MGFSRALPNSVTCNPAAVKKTLHAFGVAGGDNARIGHQQNFFRAQFAGQFADAFDAVHAKNQPRARLIIKRPGGGY